MCTGAEIMMGASLVLGAYSTYAASHQQQQAAPKVVKQDPVADDTEAQRQAAQDAQFATLQQRERARHNSLLSAAGGAGDSSTPVLGRPTATGKTALGEA